MQRDETLPRETITEPQLTLHGLLTTPASVTPSTPLTFLDLMEVLNQWMEPVRKMQELMEQAKDIKTKEQAGHRYKTGIRMVVDRCHAVSREALAQLDKIDDTTTLTYDDKDNSRIIKEAPISHQNCVKIFSNLTDLVHLDILSKHTHAERIRVYTLWLQVMKLLHDENNYFATKAILVALNNKLLQFSSILQTELPKDLLLFMQDLERKNYGTCSYDMPRYKKHSEQNQTYVPHFAVFKQTFAALAEKEEIARKEDPYFTDPFKQELLAEFTSIQARLEKLPVIQRLSPLEQPVFYRPLLNAGDLEKLFGLIRLRDFQESLARLHLTLPKLKEHYKNNTDKAAIILSISVLIANLRASLAAPLTNANSVGQLQVQVQESLDKLKAKKDFSVFKFKEDRRGLFGPRPYKNKLPTVFNEALTLFERINNFVATCSDFNIQDPTKACVLQPVSRGSKVMPRTNSSLTLTGSFGGIQHSSSTMTLRPLGSHKR